MSRDSLNSRPLAENERALLGAVLGLEPFSGRMQLESQLDHVVVVGGVPFQLDLMVVGGSPPSNVQTGPIPTRAVVVNADGQPIGEVVVWVAYGYLSGLEYAWFADEKPGQLPDPQQLVSA